MLTAATGDLAGVGSTKSAQAEAIPSTEVDPAAAEVVSMLTAQVTAARDMFVKSFATNPGPQVATEPSDARAAI